MTNMSKKEIKKVHGIPVDCSRKVPNWLVLLDNIPTLGLFILGIIILYWIHWALAIGFGIYCAVSIIFFWGRICVYCHHYGTRACPCGYGVFSKKFFKFKGTDDFKSKFKKNILIMFPAWFIPLGVGIILLIIDRDILKIVIFAIFCIDGFILIPAISKFVGCRNCEIKDKCPWMT